MDVVYFWNGWEPVFRILVVGSITYFGLVILLRLSGKRTLTRMTSFDFVIAITIGSAFGRILTARSVSISEALTTFLLLIGLQTIFSFLKCIQSCSRSSPLQDQLCCFTGGNS